MLPVAGALSIIPKADLNRTADCMNAIPISQMLQMLF